MDSKKENNQSVTIWQQSLNHAIHISKIKLSEPTTSYVAKTIDHQMRNTDINTDPIGMAWIEHCQPYSREDAKEIGNKCLIICGFFPWQAYHRNTKLSFYISIGQAAYQEAAKQAETPFDEKLIFDELESKFIAITQTISLIKHPSLRQHK